MPRKAPLSLASVSRNKLRILGVASSSAQDAQDLEQLEHLVYVTIPRPHGRRKDIRTRFSLVTLTELTTLTSEQSEYGKLVYIRIQHDALMVTCPTQSLPLLLLLKTTIILLAHRLL